MTRSSLCRALSVFVFTTVVPLVLLGCPKKPAPAVQDAEAPPPPASTEPTEIAPLVEDAGEDAAPEGGAKKWSGGGGGSPNQVKIQACCNAMRSEARQMGPTSPEGFQLNAMASQCDIFAKQVGPSGAAPEFNQLRQLLRSVKLPTACQF